MSEVKKAMPGITNYLSDNDDENDDVSCNTVTTPQVHTNYAEWKRLKKSSSHLQNGDRSVNKPLADISSSEEDTKFDDNEPLFKIMNNLSDKDEFRRRNENIRRKYKKPSHFLLFSRMKQQIHFDCSFGNLCHITQASWQNMEASENEELIGDIDRRIRDYKESLLKFKSVLLPESTTISTNSTSVSTIATRSSSAISNIIKPAAIVDEEDEENVTLTLSINNSPKTETVIPERLQNLAGDASVYNAPEKSKRINYHELKSSKRRSLYTSDNSLNYVNALNSDQNCNFPDCENRPIDDYRWDGQYCSAKCLIKDCHSAFTDWIDDQKSILTNGDQMESRNDVGQEIVLCLESPSHNYEELPKRNNVQTDLFERPKTRHINRIVPGRHRSKMNRTLLRNLTSDSDQIRSTKRQSLGSSSPLEDFDSFCDNQARDFVT